MATNTINAFSVGTFSDLDTNESDFNNENNGILAGQTFGSIGSPIHESVTSLRLDDEGRSNVQENDNGQNAGTLRADGTTSDLDSSSEWNVTITYVDGSTVSSEMLVLQDTSGRVFLTPYIDGNALNDVLDDQAIRSISLDSVAGDSFHATSLNLENIDFVCFATGTLIGTPDGPRPVEMLEAGDPVITADQGAQPLLWRGARRLDFRVADARQKPVEIKPGALGPGAPARRLVLSPQHRVLVRDRDGAEVLALAKGLLGAPGIRRMNGCRQVTYHTLLFARHQVIFAEGAPVESFYPGPYSMTLLTWAQRLAVLALFPDLAGGTAAGYGPPARALVKRREAEALATGGLAGGKALVQG